MGCANSAIIGALPSLPSSLALGIMVCTASSTACGAASIPYSNADRALLGGAVTGSEEYPETKAVLGYCFWIRRFGGDPRVLGSTLVLNGQPRMIVGIMPPRFMFSGADMNLPSG
jgi:hypothetical protein